MDWLEERNGGLSHLKQNGILSEGQRCLEDLKRLILELSIR